MSRAQLIGTYIAVRVVVSLFALATVWHLWPQLTTGPWSPVRYLLVAALVPGSELLVVPVLSVATDGVTRRGIGAGRDLEVRGDLPDPPAVDGGSVGRGRPREATRRGRTGRR